MDVARNKSCGDFLERSVECAGANGSSVELIWFWQTMSVGCDDDWALSVMCLGKLMMDVRFVEGSEVTASR